jgi:hypothetical protein
MKIKGKQVMPDGFDERIKNARAREKKDNETQVFGPHNDF